MNHSDSRRALAGAHVDIVVSIENRLCGLDFCCSPIQKQRWERPARRCLKMMKCHHIYGQVFVPGFREMLEPLAFGRSLPAQAFTGPDSGGSEIPGPGSQILGEGSFPQRRGKFMLPDGAEECSLQFQWAHIPRLFFLARTPSTQRRSSLPAG